MPEKEFCILLEDPIEQNIVNVVCLLDARSIEILEIIPEIGAVYANISKSDIKILSESPAIANIELTITTHAIDD